MTCSQDPKQDDREYHDVFFFFFFKRDVRGLREESGSSSIAQIRIFKERQVCLSSLLFKKGQLCQRVL